MVLQDPPADETLRTIAAARDLVVREVSHTAVTTAVAYLKRGPLVGRSISQAVSANAAIRAHQCILRRDGGVTPRWVRRAFEREAWDAIARDPGPIIDDARAAMRGGVPVDA